MATSQEKRLKACTASPYNWSDPRHAATREALESIGVDDLVHIVCTYVGPSSTVQLLLRYPNERVHTLVSAQRTGADIELSQSPKDRTVLPGLMRMCTIADGAGWIGYDERSVIALKPAWETAGSMFCRTGTPGTSQRLTGWQCSGALSFLIRWDPEHKCQILRVWEDSEVRERLLWETYINDMHSIWFGPACGRTFLLGSHMQGMRAQLMTGKLMLFCAVFRQASAWSATILAPANSSTITT